MNVLGIHYGHHDASVTLVRDGKIVASISEDRLNRLKHYSGLPIKSLDYCLMEGGIEAKDVDMIALPTASPYDKKLDLIIERKSKGPLAFANYTNEAHLNDYLRFFALNIVKKLHGLVHEELPLYEKRFPVPREKPILSIDHHLAHAASTYYTSGFDQKALVVTADGAGDLLSLTVWVGQEGKLSPRYKVGCRGSLGYFYSLVTEALGWWIGDGEGKTMGLAPYGDAQKTKGLLDPWVPHYEEGKLVKGVDFGAVGAWQVPSGAVHWHFRDAQKIKMLVQKYKAENIAAEAQRKLEEEIVPFINFWLKKEKVDYLATAGGIFLNVKLNQRLWEGGKIKKYHIFPDSGDGGLSSGAALYGYYQKSGDRNIREIKTVYWGSEYKNEEIEKMLNIRGIKYKKMDESSLVGLVAKLLSNNKIIGWFQGRMESGPRALGNRSILMDPRKAENKDVINSRVKYREAFRPFCPSMTPEAAKIFLVDPPPNSYFMVVSCRCATDRWSDIPAVVHVDGTVRPQIATEETNPLFYKLLKEFGRLTHVEALLNTSFNIKGEPIVCTPSDALKCFVDTGLDYLVMNNFLIEK